MGPAASKVALTQQILLTLDGPVPSAVKDWARFMATAGITRHAREMYAAAPLPLTAPNTEAAGEIGLGRSGGMRTCRPTTATTASPFEESPFQATV